MHNSDVPWTWKNSTAIAAGALYCMHGGQEPVTFFPSLPEHSAQWVCSPWRQQSHAAHLQAVALLQHSSHVFEAGLQVASTIGALVGVCWLQGCQTLPHIPASLSQCRHPAASLNSLSQASALLNWVR